MLETGNMLNIIQSCRKRTNYGFAISLFIIVALPAALTYLFLDSNIFWEFGSLILPQIFGNKSPPQYYDDNVPTKNTSVSTYFASEISPNLTSCHDSYGRPDLLINCCPPLPDVNVAAVDFRFPDPSKSRVRIRRPLHKADAEYLAKYRKALGIMRSLPHSDPRSFSRQAIIHCTFCSGAYDMKRYFNVDAGDSSKGPSINIHRQWMFYPFHRMYLHFHERILGSLIGDDTFSLSFWNWDHPDAMLFPDLFLSPPFDDTERDPTHFPPCMVDLSFGGVEESNSLTLNNAELLRSNLALMYNQLVSAGKRTELFMGCPLQPSEDGFCDGIGTIESAPHNTVHSWVGSAANPERENMGAFYSAGRDPSFYPHHTNIDRLWEVWRDVHGIDIPIQDPVWLNSYFYFYDENLKLVKIKVSDVLNTTKLGYAYEDVDHVWLNERPKPSVDPKIAKLELGKRESRNATGLKSNDIGQSQSQSLSNPIRIKVKRPKGLRTYREKKEEEEVLVVYGIDIKDDVDTMVKFDVYVNLVDETKLLGPSYREFVGTFVHLPQKKSTNRSRLKLGISEALEDLEADEDESIWVTLMPKTRSCKSVTIDGIRIEYMR